MTIDIGLDFYTRLTNRDESRGDGKHTAIDFRDKYLKDLYLSSFWDNDDLFIEFDFSNVEAISPSFANEAFAYFTKYDFYWKILKKIKFINISPVKYEIIKYEIKEGYSERVNTEFLPTIEESIQLSCTAHKGIVDKGGEPYILHPIRVMLSLNTLDERIVGILHDTVEDTYVNFDTLYKLRYPERIIRAVDSITRRKNEKWMDFIKRCSQNSLGIKVKIADIKDNMNPMRLNKLDYITRDRLYKKYTKALDYISKIEDIKVKENV